MEKTIIQSEDVEPGLDEPELAEMMWATFGEKMRQKTARNGLAKLFAASLIRGSNTPNVPFK